MKPIISFTPTAIDNLIRLREAHNIADSFGIRVGAKGSAGCGGGGGFSYVLGFDHKKDHDNEYMIDDFKIYINKAESLYLIGMIIDWQEDKDKQGFIFHNPQIEQVDGHEFSI